MCDNERHSLLLKWFTVLQFEGISLLSYKATPPQTWLSGTPQGNQLTIPELLLAAPDLILDQSGQPAPSPFSRVYIGAHPSSIILQYHSDDHQKVTANMERIHNSLHAWTNPWEIHRMETTGPRLNATSTLPSSNPRIQEHNNAKKWTTITMDLVQWVQTQQTIQGDKPSSDLQTIMTELAKLTVPSTHPPNTSFASLGTDNDLGKFLSHQIHEGCRAALKDISLTKSCPSSCTAQLSDTTNNNTTEIL